MSHPLNFGLKIKLRVSTLSSNRFKVNLVSKRGSLADLFSKRIQFKLRKSNDYHSEVQKGA